MTVHSFIIHNSQKVETIHMSIKWRMYEWNVAYRYNKIIIQA